MSRTSRSIPSRTTGHLQLLHSGKAIQGQGGVTNHFVRSDKSFQTTELFTNREPHRLARQRNTAMHGESSSTPRKVGPTSPATHNWYPFHCGHRQQHRAYPSIRLGKIRTQNFHHHQPGGVFPQYSLCIGIHNRTPADKNANLETLYRHAGIQHPATHPELAILSGIGKERINNGSVPFQYLNRKHLFDIRPLAVTYPNSYEMK